MNDEKKMKQATQVYETICNALTHRDWKYERHDEDMVITCKVSGEDIPMDMLFIVKPGPQVVSIVSPLPFKLPEDKRIEGAAAVAVANYGLINGAFDYDMSDGEIRFRMTSTYRDSILGEEAFIYMIMATANTVDDYNDRFLMLAKGMITLSQFIEGENRE